MIYDSDKKAQPRLAWIKTATTPPAQGTVCWVSRIAEGDEQTGLRVEEGLWRFESGDDESYSGFVGIEPRQGALRVEAVDFYCPLPQPVAPAIEIRLPEAIAREFHALPAGEQDSALYWLHRYIKPSQLADMFIGYCNGGNSIALAKAIVAKVVSEHRFIQNEVYQIVAILVAGAARLNTGYDGRNEWGLKMMTDMYAGTSGNDKDWLDVTCDDILRAIRRGL